MSKPNRYDVTRAVGELPVATNLRITEALGRGANSENVGRALENAVKHGLIERSVLGGDGGATWVISEKGRRKVGPG